ncbi:hypothetical protein ACJJTC_013054 [Scirpophaga incertulas]
MKSLILQEHHSFRSTELKTQGCPREVSTAPSQQDAQDDSNVATQRTLTPTIHLPPAHSLIRPVLPAYRDIVIGQPSQCMTQRKSEFDTVSILSDLDDGFKTVMSRKKRIANMRGTMVNCNRLRVAESTTHIYVSRFSKDVSEEDVKNHISDMGEECRGITLLKQNRETSFNSFKVEILTAKIDKFLRGEFWPVGLVFRKYKQRYLAARPTKQTNNE